MEFQNNGQPPLRGLKILEMGQLLAGPFASVLLAWFGAEVIKIEPPGAGDPLRTWRKLHKGTALWWYILGRNKKSVTLNLRHPKGQEIARRLVRETDVLLENFKPGTLEKWGLGYEELKALNPRLIMARVSGWGQTGPNSPRPGYASVAEGVSGLRYVTGFPERPPVRPNLSLGDTLAGLHAALGILMAVYHRDVNNGVNGQIVDVAIYESIFNLMESMVPEYDLYGVIRERQGSRLTGIVPTNTYRCKDGKFIIIGGNGDSIFKRLMHTAGRPDMAEDPRLATNNGRVEHEDVIDDAINKWTGELVYEEVLRKLEEAGVPVGPIYSIADIMKDPHYVARGMFETVNLPDGTAVKLPRFAPKFSETPGRTEWVGPKLGEHNDEIYSKLLGIQTDELARLQEEGVI
ncbi:MAG TPA: CaiB/BaiF CoA-transferase family protein [Blastocatellia bacterium]